MPHYLTLGYYENPIIQKYQQQFLIKLRNLWITYIGGEVPSDNFLLFPDIHGLLLFIARGENNKDTYKTILLDEYSAFLLAKGITSNSFNQVIPGTNIALTLDFFNLDIEDDTHPDHRDQNIQTGYGNKTQEEWNTLFAQSFDILRRVSPGFLSEINLMIRKIIPFGVSHKIHNSGSYSDIIGHLIMSYPVEIDYPELAILEALLHEYNHNKLNLIMQTETLILNEREDKYYSPYRPDARNIQGIYLGLHALSGTFWVIWNAHISGVLTLSDSWLEKSLLYVLKNGISLQVLDKYAILTPNGKAFLEDMRQVHRECLLYIKQASLESKIFSETQSSLVDHFTSAQKKYPNLYY